MRRFVSCLTMFAMSAVLFVVSWYLTSYPKESDIHALGVMVCILASVFSCTTLCTIAATCLVEIVAEAIKPRVNR